MELSEEIKFISKKHWEKKKNTMYFGFSQCTMDISDLNITGENYVAIIVDR